MKGAVVFLLSAHAVGALARSACNVAITLHRLGAFDLRRSSLDEAFGYAQGQVSYGPPDQPDAAD
ncbi:hypothetical protein [Chondromyces apiculatus]|uniref:Uncharacterized protein n=1 Tax=Chondromyces apiculatus DSM 436 TaxID=1192034 RepID=A0A017TE29_9BACT|nr:hypothetical protein [Chondromyces apiculatus]EYF07050.1 Hypothetical protein CAP_1309 [Chondromyces apiculatus DSM 436]